MDPPANLQDLFLINTNNDLYKYLLKIYERAHSGQGFCKNCSCDHWGEALRRLNPFTETVSASHKACCSFGNHSLETVATVRRGSHFFSIIPVMQRKVECSFRSLCVSESKEQRSVIMKTGVF